MSRWNQSRFIWFVAGDFFALFLNALGYFLCARCLSSFDFGLFSLCQNAIQWFAPLILWSFSSYGIHLIQASHCPVRMAWRMTRFRLLVASISSLFILTFSFPLLSLNTTYQPLNVMIAMTFSSVLLLIRGLEQDHLSLALDRVMCYYSFRIVYAGGFFLCILFIWTMQDPSLFLLLALQVASMSFAIIIQRIFLKNELSGLRSQEVKATDSRLEPRDVLNAGMITGGSFCMMGAYNLDIFMLVYFRIGTAEEVATYAVLAKCVQFAVLPMSAAITSQVNTLARSYFDKDADVFRTRWKKLAMITAISGVMGALGIIACGPFLLEMVLGKPHSLDFNIMACFALIYLLIGLAAPSISVLPYVQAGKTYLAHYFIVLLVVVLASLWFLPVYGIIGAPMALAAGLVVLTLSATISFYYMCMRQFSAPSGLL